MSETFVIDVNGAAREVRCDRDTPLLYVLRNDLGLMGTRFGCGLGLCGACNVLVDGRPVHSCDTPIWSVAGKRITTVEGLGTEQDPHPVQREFLAHQAFQCGYCSSGMMISAAALLARSRNPDAAEVRQALNDNLCRCGTHQRIVDAVVAAGADAS
jgi:nicotinate dehydrogenase subunit A